MGQLVASLTEVFQRHGAGGLAEGRPGAGHSQGQQRGDRQRKQRAGGLPKRHPGPVTAKVSSVVIVRESSGAYMLQFLQ